MYEQQDITIATTQSGNAIEIAVVSLTVVSNDAITQARVC